jgi:hypothetical protein
MHLQEVGHVQHVQMENIQQLVQVHVLVPVLQEHMQVEKLV